MNSTKQHVLEAVKEVLAADCACSPALWQHQGLFVVRADQQKGRRNFPLREKQLFIVSFGKAVVFSCDESRIEWVRQNLGSLDRDEIFSASTIAQIEEYVGQDNQFMAGPDLQYLCSKDTWQKISFPADLSCEVYEGQAIFSLYDHEGFGDALSYDEDETVRPDIIAVVATYGDEIVGIAGASADHSYMWQVGVDVLEEYQGKGIGSALVSTVTELILEKGKIPYYSTVSANIASRALALKSGYWPAWVELYAC